EADAAQADLVQAQRVEQLNVMEGHILDVIDLLEAAALPEAGMRGDVNMKMLDRKSTRLNSSHLGISYAVFCLKKKNNQKTTVTPGATASYHTLPVSDTHTVPPVTYQGHDSNSVLHLSAFTCELIMRQILRSHS